MAVMGARASEARRCYGAMKKERERRLVDTWRWRVERGSRYSREMRWRNLPLLMGCVERREVHVLLLSGRSPDTARAVAYSTFVPSLLLVAVWVHLGSRTGVASF